MSLVRRMYLWFRKKALGIDDRSMLEIAIENGLRIGEDYAVMGEVILDPSHCWLIEIGNKVTIAPRVHILAHDASTKRELGYTEIGRVRINDNVFIGAGSIILPGVTIGNNVIIGAGSVVTHDIPNNSVAVGNPCRVIKTYDEYMQTHRKRMETAPLFEEDCRIGRITPEGKHQMRERLKDQNGYVR